MKIRLISTLAGVLGLAGLAMAGPAMAQTANYPPTATTVTVSRTEVPAGGTVDVSGTATPNSTVTFSIAARVLGTAFTNNAGAFRAAVTIPCEVTGAQTLRTTGPGVNASTALNITGSTAACVGGTGTDTGTNTGTGATTGSLPRTGSSSTAPLTAAGAGLVVIGAAAAVTARRRRAADSI